MATAEALIAQDRAHEAARDTGLKLIVGAEFQLDDGPKLVLLCESMDGYTAMCALITRGRRAAVKGSYRLTRDDFSGGLPGTRALMCVKTRSSHLNIATSR